LRRRIGTALLAAMPVVVAGAVPSATASVRSGKNVDALGLTWTRPVLFDRQQRRIQGFSCSTIRFCAAVT